MLVYKRRNTCARLVLVYKRQSTRVWCLYTRTKMHARVWCLYTSAKARMFGACIQERKCTCAFGACIQAPKTHAYVWSGLVESQQIGKNKHQNHLLANSGMRLKNASFGNSCGQNDPFCAIPGRHIFFPTPKCKICPFSEKKMKNEKCTAPRSGAVGQLLILELTICFPCDPHSTRRNPPILWRQTNKSRDMAVQGF